MPSTIYKVLIEVLPPDDNIPSMAWNLGSRVLQESLHVREEPDDLFPHLVRHYALCGIMQQIYTLSECPINPDLVIWPYLPSGDTEHNASLLPAAKGIFLGKLQQHRGSTALPSFTEISDRLHDVARNSDLIKYYPVCLPDITRHFGQYGKAMKNLYASLTPEEERALKIIG